MTSARPKPSSSEHASGVVDEPLLSLENVVKHYPPPPPMRLRRFFARFRGLHVENGFSADAMASQELEDDDEVAEDDDPVDELPQPAPFGCRVIDGVTLQAHAGSVIGLTGPPGAGKTVLLKLAGGLVAPSEGRVVVRGLVAPALSIMSLVLPTKGHTVKTALPQLGAMVGIAPRLVHSRFDQIKDLMRAPALLQSSTSLMESGRKRDLLVATALSVDPDIVLLDMPIPSNAFGDRCLRRLDELRSGGTLVMAEMGDPRKSRLVPDRVVVLERGRIAEQPAPPPGREERKVERNVIRKAERKGQRNP